MGFRTRLNLFFVLMVVVPLLAVGVVANRLLDDLARDRSDVRLDASVRVVDGLLRESRDRATDTLAELGSRREVVRALVSGDPEAVAPALEAGLDRDAGARRLRWSPLGGTAVEVGGDTAVLPVSRPVLNAAGRRVGRLEAAASGPRELVRRLVRLTGLEVALRVDGRLVGASSPLAARVAPSEDTASVDAGDDRRASTVTLRTVDGRTQVTLVSAADASTTGVLAGGGLWLILAGMLALGLAGAAFLSRSLTRRVDAFLAAVRRVAAGRFDEDVPGGGDDEFGELASEFNRMRDQVAEERARLNVALRRLGEAFGSSLDREGLLALVLRAALEGVRGDAGRVLLVADGELEPAVVDGDLSDVAEAIVAAERVAEVDRTGAARQGGVAALAAVLPSEEGEVSGMVAIGRRGPDFSDGERELFDYLGGQVAVSIRNVRRHERVAAAARRDPLTGLANRRELDGVLDVATADARELDGPVALVLLDIDRFKQINDVHGHQAGDAVLQTVTDALHSVTRDGDVAARWGGEEFAILLPGADGRQAGRVAERLRVAVEAASTPMPDGGEAQVTASVGVAVARGADAFTEELVAAADDALYRAKRAGRNRTVTADGSTIEG